MSVIWDLFKTFPNAGCPGTFPNARCPGTFPNAGCPGTFPNAGCPGIFPNAGCPGTFPNAGCLGTFPNTGCPGTFLSSSNQFNFFPHQLFLIISYDIAASIKMTYLDVAAEREFAFQNKYLNILGSFCYEVKWYMHQLHTVKV